jgi:PKHD-type hydroxylase
MNEWEAFYYCEIQAVTLTTYECQAIIDQIQTLSEEHSVLYNHTGEQTRSCGIRWLHANQGAQWLFDRINERVADYNRRYNFDIEPVQAAQMTRYGIGHEYRNHVDIGAGPMSLRKISCSIELTDPATYEGGGLEVGGDRIYLGRGDMALFPSMMLHRALPVTAGERWSLVCWILGSTPLK